MGRGRGEMSMNLGRSAKYYYVGFVGVALAVSVSTDFFNDVACDL